MTATTKVGFIGLGTMGAHMARNLQKAGAALVVHDMRRESAVPLVEAGAEWAGSPAEVAAAAGVVFTSLPGPPEVEAVAVAPGGLAEGARRGLAWFDLTTNSPTAVRRLHQRLAEAGVDLLDAPVSGGPAGAEAGTLALWVSGNEETYRRHEALLGAIGNKARYVGAIGTGTVAKLVHNLMGYIINVGIAEVFTLGAKAGVDPVELWKLVREGAINRVPAFDLVADRLLGAQYDPPAFQLKLAHKDVGLAVALGRELGVPMRVANLTLEEMTEALNRGWGNRDSRSSMLLQLERAGVEFSADAAEIRAIIAGKSAQ
jgi:3-hydroxyisobutyrate dehydrogenase